MTKTIYFIPGTMCDERLWQPTWQLLDEQFSHSCQLVHLPIPTSGNMDQVVESIAKKIAEEGAVLVGFSLGGYIASAIVAKFPELISHLVVVSNMPKNLPDTEIEQRKRTIAWIANRGYAGIPNKRIEDLLHPAIKQFDAEGFIRIKNTIVDMDQDLGGNVLLHQLEVSLSRPALLSCLSCLNLPVQFLVGDADTLVDIAKLKQETQGAANISINIIDNIGHMLPLEAPQILALALNKLVSPQ